MEKNKGIKTVRVICMVMVILCSILNLTHAYNIVPLSDVWIRTVGILNLLALFGLAYSTFKMKNDNK